MVPTVLVGIQIGPSKVKHHIGLMSHSGLCFIGSSALNKLGHNYFQSKVLWVAFLVEDYLHVIFLPKHLNLS